MGCLYSKLKVFHFPEKIRSLPRENPAVLAPVHVRLKPTNICNHRCSYCAYRAKDLQLGKDMSLRDSLPREKLLEIIADFSEMGVLSVTFSGGGEPFCHPDLGEAVEALASYGISFAALTNGSKLAGRLAQLFAAQGTWLRVSMDGYDGPSYARYRGVSEGEFATVMGNLERFSALGGQCLLGVSYIVDRANHRHIRAMLGRLHDAGVKSVKISPCIVSNNGTENNRYHLEFFDVVREEIERAKSDFGVSGLEIVDAYHLIDDKFEKDYDWCPYQQILPVIGADQNVYTCQDKAYNLDCGLLGSIEGTRFAKFWHENKERFFAVTPRRDCKHHCVANEKNRLILEYLNIDPRHAAFV